MHLGVVVTFAEKTTEDNDCLVGEVLGLVDAFGVEEAAVSLGNAVVVFVQIVAVRFDNEVSATAYTTEVQCVVCLGKFFVDFKSGFAKSAVECYKIVTRTRTGAGALRQEAVVTARPTEYVDAVVFLHGEYVVFVLQHYCACLFHFLCKSVVFSTYRSCVFVVFEALSAQERRNYVEVLEADYVTYRKRNNQNQRYGTYNNSFNQLFLRSFHIFTY